MYEDEMYEDESLEEFICRFDFTEEEVMAVRDELDSYRTIPGTNLAKYIRRVVVTIDEESRPAFLKGLIVGAAIRLVAEGDRDRSTTI